MADDFDVEEMLEAPYKKEVGINVYIAAIVNRWNAFLKSSNKYVSICWLVNFGM